MIIHRTNIHFVLVRTQFASNLGSTVRVMKNMGIGNLILVQPECEVGMEARSYAMRGADILDQALFYPSLEAVGEKLSGRADTGVSVTLHATSGGSVSRTVM